MGQDWAHWDRAFSEHDVTCGRIAKTEDHVDDEQTREGGLLVEFGDGTGLRTINSPLYVQGEKKCAPRAAPDVGEHTLAILTELGVDEETISVLTGTA